MPRDVDSPNVPVRKPKAKPRKKLVRVADPKGDREHARGRAETRKVLEPIERRYSEVKDVKAATENERAEKFRKTPAFKKAAADAAYAGAVLEGKPLRVASKRAAGAVQRAATGTGKMSPYEIAGRAVVGLTRATIEDPGAVVGKTLKSIPKTAAGSVAGTVDLVVHPKKILKLPGELKADLKRRYGPLAAGDSKAFRERVKQEGALPEVIDTAVAVVPSVGATGRALTAPAKAGRLGKKAQRVAAQPRPKLRVTAGNGGAVAQDKSPNLLVAAVQHKVDRSRAKKAQKRKATGEMRGLVPEQGEVVKSTLRGQNRTQRRLVAKAVGRGGVRQRNVTAREVDRGIEADRKQARKATPKPLRKTLADAETLALEGLLNFDDAAATRATLVARREQIAKGRGEREASHPDHDDLARIDRVIAALDADPAAVLSPQLREFHGKQVARQERIAALDDALNADTAQARALGPSGRTLGVEQIPAETKKEARARQRTVKAQRARADKRVTRATSAVAVRRGQRRATVMQAVDRPVPLKRAERVTDYIDRALALPEPELARLVRREEADAKRVATAKDIQQKARAQKLVRRKGESDKDYIARVRTAREGTGLAEPVYVLHRRKQMINQPSTGGALSAPGVKSTEYRLFDRGEQDVTPGAYTEGVRRTIKRTVTWNTMADLIDRNAVSWSRGRDGGGKKLEALRKEVDALGLNAQDWTAVNVQAFRRTRDSSNGGRGDDLSVSGDELMHTALNNATADLLSTDTATLLPSSRFVLVPKAVAEEIADQARSVGRPGRLARKWQGLQSRVLLHTNPTFVPIQVLSNTPLAVFALKGNVKDLIAGQRWYRGLDQTGKDAVDDIIGLSASVTHADSAKFQGDSESKIVNGWRVLADSDRAQRAKGSRLNPFTWNPRLDETQNAFFRKAVFYNEAKRRAARDMNSNMAGVIEDAKPVIDILNMPDGPQKAQALRDALPEIERIGSRVEDFLGDYTSYTAAERRYLKTALLFYGFMRWSVRFAFYTLPVKHPLAAAITAKLGQLQVEEVIDLLASEAEQQGITREQAERELRDGFPFAFGRVYLTGGGKLQSVDLTRLNPLGNPLVEALDNPITAGLGLMSPALGALMDIGYKRSSFADRPLNVSGQRTARGQDPVIGADESWRIFVRNMARTAFPIRLADDLLNPEEQGDDSLPILGDRPVVVTSEKAIDKQQGKLEDKGDVLTRARRALIPLQPRPDHTADAVVGKANSRNKKLKKSSGGSGLTWGDGGGSGSGLTW